VKVFATERDDHGVTYMDMELGAEEVIEALRRADLIPKDLTVWAWMTRKGVLSVQLKRAVANGGQS
jgi:hypothetical protein